MATTKQFNNQIVGLLAGAALTQYSAVKHASTAGEVIAAAAQVSTAAANAISIVQNDPADGEPALLPGVGDKCKAIAGEQSIAVGAWLTCNSTGLIATSAGVVVAQAMEATSAVGDYFQVEIIRAKL